MEWVREVLQNLNGRINPLGGYHQQTLFIKRTDGIWVNPLMFMDRQVNLKLTFLLKIDFPLNK